MGSFVWLFHSRGKASDRFRSGNSKAQDARVCLVCVYWVNALQVKFSYAITCHKSQGGQWDTVFVEQPYLPGQPDREYLRWLYTAVTRARSCLYLIGFRNDFFVSAE